MKKFFITFSIIAFIFAFLFSFYSFSNKLSTKKSKNSPDIAETQATSISPDSSIKEPVGPEKAIPKMEIPIYNILGNAQRPTIYPNTAMKQWRAAVVTLASSYRDSLYINGTPEKKNVALTFDDGPDGVNTPKILKILKDNQVRATFFCIGTSLEKNKAVILNAFNDGNVIASHCWSHKDLTTLNKDSITVELSKTEQQIYNIIGKKPALIRPPYGAINSAVQDILVADGYKSVLWSIDTLDWSQRESSNIVNNVVNNVRPGEIILMHCDGDKAATTEALPIIIQKLKLQGYNFVTIDEMAESPAYK